MLPLSLAFALAMPPLVEKPDVTFFRIDGESLQLDFVAPRGGGPYPCVVCLHGGAWKLGSRKGLAGKPEFGIDFGPGTKSLIERLAFAGYAAVSVDYRLAPKHKFPAQIVDVKTAIRYLRANARVYNIDPKRIAVLGLSAGGHLAALVATTPGLKEFAGDEFPNESDDVACVVNYFGPADLTLYCDTPGIELAFLKPLFGGVAPQCTPQFRKASPVEHVTKDAPPFLHFHGTADFVVPIIHTERLHAKLKEEGVQSEFVRVKGKGHGWTGDTSTQTLATAIQFLDKHLKDH